MTNSIDKASQAPVFVTRLLNRWHKLESVIAVTCFSFIAGVIMLDVLGRELLGPVLRGMGYEPGSTGIFSSQRVAIYALVIGSYMGIGIATATGSHLVPRVGHGLVPASWGPALDRAADAISGVFLCAIAWYGWVFVEGTRMLDMRAPILDWPLWLLQLAIPIGFASAAGRFFAFAVWPGAKPKPAELKD